MGTARVASWLPGRFLFWREEKLERVGYLPLPANLFTRFTSGRPRLIFPSVKSPAAPPRQLCFLGRISGLTRRASCCLREVGLYSLLGDPGFGLKKGVVWGVGVGNSELAATAKASWYWDVRWMSGMAPE